MDILITFGMATDGSFKSPEMFDPARIPVAAGKNIEKTVKKFSLSEKSDHKFSARKSVRRLKWPSELSCLNFLRGLIDV